MTNFERRLKEEFKILETKFEYSSQEAMKIVKDLVQKNRLVINRDGCSLWLDKNNKCTEKEAECIAICSGDLILKNIKLEDLK